MQANKSGCLFSEDSV